MFRRCVSPGAERFRRLASVSGIDACHYGSYECCGIDVGFHSGFLD
jgi:hypothetical protein